MHRIVRGGEISEITGRLSSGRTSVLLSCIADVTRRGAVAALVDVDDTFDPESAARVGVDLARVLWVRCGGRRATALRALDVLVRCPGFGLVVLDSGETPPRLTLPAAFRLKLAARRADVALVFVGRQRVAGSSASLVLETVRAEAEWRGPASTPTRLARVESRLRVVRAVGALAGERMSA